MARTRRFGCFYAEGALLDGDVVSMLDGVESPGACCRACRELGSDTCGVWNYCANPDGCRWAGIQGAVCVCESEGELQPITSAAASSSQNRQQQEHMSMPHEHAATAPPSQTPQLPPPACLASFAALQIRRPAAHGGPAAGAVRAALAVPGRVSGLAARPHLQGKLQLEAQPETMLHAPASMGGLSAPALAGTAGWFCSASAACCATR